MAYTVPDLNDYLPGEPYTSAKALLMVENPIAIANGDDGAPRVSPKAWGHTAISDSVVGTVTLSDFSGYGGAHIEIKYRNNSVGTTSLVLSLSNDGATFGSTAVIADVLANDSGSVSIFVDFATGATQSVWQMAGGAGIYTNSAGVPGADISHIRLFAGGTTTTTIAALAFANAGPVA